MSKERVEILIEALPYIREFYEKVFVIKYGGSAQEEIKSFCEDIVLLKYIGINPVIVHGGGQEINKIMNKLQIKTDFYEGLRITDEKTMEIVTMVLAGKVNKQIVMFVNDAGGRAIGMSGVDGKLIKAKKKTTNDINLGYVGEIIDINVLPIKTISNAGYIPIISPIGFGEDGKNYNINADTVASEIAISLKAEKLIYLTDTDGINDENNNKVSSITIEKAEDFIKSNIVQGGMIPKLEGAICAVKVGVKKCHIINGRKKHALLEEVFTKSGVGTEICLN
ncbi:MAG: acetylglutamate kinase [Deltaproteobacteria bacterium]|nr:acetylglutamate kinase [Deltaproteobacteria bacterium]